MAITDASFDALMIFVRVNRCTPYICTSSGLLVQIDHQYLIGGEIGRGGTGELKHHPPSPYFTFYDALHAQ